MRRWDIINALIKKINATRYLEIGIADAENFNHIECQHKIGVDPGDGVSCTFNITSDEFFAKNNEIFDIIFIDGLHHSDQVYMDIKNSLNCLSYTGYIICHDMNPHSEIIQRVPKETNEWTGDCWKAWLKFRMEADNLHMFVVNTDYGCGVISHGKQNLLTGIDELTYDKLVDNRTSWLNLISPQDFIAYVSNSSN